jgi:SH3 domain protein
VGTVNAGEEVSVLQTNDSTNYAQVRDSSGRTAWIPLKELSNTSPACAPACRIWKTR